MIANKEQIRRGERKDRKRTEENETISVMSWNINGWKGDEREDKKKIRRVKGEVIQHDVFILTETHLKDDEEDVRRLEKEFPEYSMFHVHMDEKEKRSKKGVTVGIKKRRIDEKDIRIERDKGEKGERGRWIRVTIKGLLDEDLHIWGIYAPVVATDRKKWMREVGKKIGKKQGYRIVMGDFNFVMDTKLDKIRGNKKKGTEGRKEQEEWEKEFGIFDVWRSRNPGVVATTWTGRGPTNTKVKTRIDRILIDERIDDRVTETRIDKTRVSDHDVVMMILETRREKKLNRKKEES